MNTYQTFSKSLNFLFDKDLSHKRIKKSLIFSIFEQNLKVAKQDAKESLSRKYTLKTSTH